jgi:hypothetical protein
MKLALALLAGCSFTGAPIAATPSDGPRVTSDAPHITGDSAASDASTGDPGLPGGVAATPILWLVGDDALHDPLSAVTSWPDRGPNHLDLAVDSSLTPPTFNPATPITAATLKFSTSRLARAGGLLPMNTALTDLTLVTVVKDDTSSAFEWLLYTGTIGYDRLSVSRSWNGSPMRWDFDLTTSNRDSSTQPDGRAMVMTYVASVGSMVSTANHRELYVNGAATGGSTSFAAYVSTGKPLEVGDGGSASFAAYVSTGKPLEVGDHDDGAGGDSSNYPYDGFIGEIYLASSVPASQSELEQLETYFALRYGITLAHPYRDATGAMVWDALAAYNTHVAGLAIDPAAHLDVRTAGATDGGDLLRIAAQAPPTNAHAYLIGGDNNLAVTYASGRLQRIWRFSAAAWTAPVTLDIAGPGAGTATALPSQGGNQLTLLVDTTAAFANPMMIPMTVGTNHRYTATVTLPATAYVTLAVQ